MCVGNGRKNVTLLGVFYLEESNDGDVVRFDELSCCIHRVEHGDAGNLATLQPLDDAR